MRDAGSGEDSCQLSHQLAWPEETVQSRQVVAQPGETEARSWDWASEGSPLRLFFGESRILVSHTWGDPDRLLHMK